MPPPPLMMMMILIYAMRGATPELMSTRSTVDHKQHTIPPLHLPLECHLWARHSAKEEIILRRQKYISSIAG